MTNVIKDDWRLDQEGIKLVISSREYFANQDYVKAINSLNKALKIKKEIYGESTPQIALIYSFFGGIYSSMYDYKKALFFYNKSYKILEKHKVLSTRHSSYIHHNLSFLYRDMGDNKQALEYMKKYISAKEGYYIKKLQIQLGTDVNIAEDYRDVALIYLALKEYKSAKKYLEASINIYERTLGKNHVITSFSYRTLGYLFLLTNDFDISLYYLTLALKIQEENLKESNAYISETYIYLSLLYSKIDAPCKAYSFSLLSFNNFLKIKNKSFAILNSKQKTSYLSSNNGGIYSLMNHLIQCSILSKNKKMDSALLDTFTSWIKYKGNIFEYENILTMIENQVLDLDIKKDIKNLKILTQRLASNQFYIESTKDNKILERKIENIQVKLSHSHEKFKKFLDLDNISFKDIIINLKPNQLYIDFVKGDEHYYIFTLNRNNEINFKQIIKKDTKTLVMNIKKFKINNKEVVEKIKNKDLKSEEEKKEAITQLKYKSQTILSSLYDIIIKTYLSTELKNKTSLIISPDGLLNFLPFEALYHNGKYLIEDYKISYISSGREFVRQTKRKKANPKYKMICFGNPDFNASLPISRIKGRFGANNPKVEESWEQFQNFASIGNAEIVTIRNLYENSLIYEGKEATVENLMSVGASQILHLSTHGKFLNSESIENPMLKAGLAFSGANDRTSLSGIVTALQISALDLQDTELVVLSACESGLGEVQNAEGVMGLPKAFLQAGARNVIMSLWSVSNQKTAMLMKRFYENVQNGQDYESALRNAKLKMIEMHPYYWSAFIMHGIQN